MSSKISRRSVLSMSAGAVAGAGVLARGFSMPLAPQQRGDRSISLLDPPPVGMDPYKTIDPDHKTEYVQFRAEDGRQSSGLLHLPKSGKAEVCIVQAHPEGDTGMDWRYPYLTRDGIAGMGVRHRYVQDDKNLIMEEIMLDLAAAIKYLKQERGIKRIVLLGHSGGGSTMCYYQSQAETRPPNRVSKTVTGDPPDLNKYDLPPGDGLVMSASHWGRGWTVLHRIDPSVSDETDPISCDPTLDMYNPANGFQIPPKSSKYSPEFVEKYHAGQEARMNRLVARAWQLVEEKKRAQELMKDPSFSRRSSYEQAKIERAAITEHIMTIYRKEACLKYTDLSLDPSDRIVGSNRGSRPDLSNYEGGFHPQPIKPRSFLCSESTASNVYTPKTIKAVTVPVLVMCGTADLNEWPDEQKHTLDSATNTKDKEIIWIVGANHPYLPSGPKAGERDQRDKAGNALNGWIKKRFS